MMFPNLWTIVFLYLS